MRIFLRSGLNSAGMGRKQATHSTHSAPNNYVITAWAVFRYGRSWAMSESSQERWVYEGEGDILDVYFDGFAGERPVRTIELADKIRISIDRAAGRALALGLLDFRKLVQRTPFGPHSFPCPWRCCPWRCCPWMCYPLPKAPAGRSGRRRH